MFSITSTEILRNDYVAQIQEEAAGALVIFEGWVRNHNEGKPVTSLEYQVYKELAEKEGQKIIAEAIKKFNLKTVVCVHREGHLKIGDIAVWIGATAAHRDDAFKASRYIIDEIKYRLPVWKKEHYQNAPADWVFCRHHLHHVHFLETDYYKKQNQVVDQNKLKKSKVCIIGMGGLGNPVLTYLAAAGIGNIRIIDFDKIDISNIHRQPLFSPNLVGEKKVLVAQSKALEINPYIQVEAIDTYIDESNITSLIEGFDLVLDCTDNLKTKYLIHDACFQSKQVLISASLYKWEGQVRTFNPHLQNGCLRCLQSETPNDTLIGNCNDFGIVGISAGVIGTLQASEAIQFLLFQKNMSENKTILLNLQNLEQNQISPYKKPQCECCLGQKKLDSQNSFEIDYAELSKDYLLIDIREQNENILQQHTQTPQKVAVMCQRGVRSLEAVKKMREQGYQNFYSVKGGACSL